MVVMVVVMTIVVVIFTLVVTGTLRSSAPQGFSISD